MVQIEVGLGSCMHGSHASRINPSVCSDAGAMLYAIAGPEIGFPCRASAASQASEHMDVSMRWLLHLSRLHLQRPA